MSILLPVAIQLLEFKSEAEMSHVPQTPEALHFGRDPGSPGNLGNPGAFQASGAVQAVSKSQCDLL